MNDFWKTQARDEQTDKEEVLKSLWFVLKNNEFASEQSMQHVDHNGIHRTLEDRNLVNIGIERYGWVAKVWKPIQSVSWKLKLTAMLDYIMTYQNPCKLKWYNYHSYSEGPLQDIMSKFKVKGPSLNFG